MACPLGVASKAAHLRLVKETHQDANPGDEEATKRFKQVQAAYDCLRKADLLTLVKANGDFSQVGYGTPLLPLDPRVALRTGAFTHVPVMQGNTREEQGFFGWLYEEDGKFDAADYRRNLVKSFGDQADAVARQYPLSAHDSPMRAWNSLATDRGWICPALTSNRQLAQRVPVYSYSFADHTVPNFVGQALRHDGLASFIRRRDRSAGH